MLGEAKANAITQHYNGAREVVAIEFEIVTPHGPLWFRLPADMRPALATLNRQAMAGKIEKRYAKPDQAKRVAWRILTQWVQAQLALIELGSVQPEQVLLPYVVDRRTGRTVYELMLDKKFSGLALPAPGESSCRESVDAEVIG